MAARGGTDPCRLLPPSAAPLPPYIPRHAFSDLPGNLGSAPNCRAQRLRHDPRARRRDAAVRVRRGHPAPDDALRGELCAVGDFLHAFSCRSLSRGDRIDQDPWATGANGADAVVWAERGEEGGDAGASAWRGRGSVRGGRSRGEAGVGVGGGGGGGEGCGPEAPGAVDRVYR